MLDPPSQAATARNTQKALFHKRSIAWLTAAALCLALQRILPSSFWDVTYYQGIFPWMRRAHDYTFGLLPLPALYLVLAFILYRTVKWFRIRDKSALYRISKALGGVAALVMLFYLLWGFNYGQQPLQKRLGYDLRSVNEKGMYDEFNRATAVLIHEAGQLPGNLKTDEAIMRRRVTDGQLRPDVRASLSALGLPDKGRVRVRQVWPKGTLLRWSTAGIYIPQTGEGHIDKGLLSVQKPFTIAHEMAHGYGVTDEGACNFIAWLACSRSADPWVRYGGALTYWRYTAAEMHRDTVKEVMKTLPGVVKRSVELIHENDRRYPDIMPRLRDRIYASYLRRHGIQGGLRSYNYVVMMVYLYRQSLAVPDRNE